MLLLRSVHIVLLLAIVATLVAHWLVYSLEDTMAPYCGAGLTISSIIRFTGSSIRMVHQAFMSRVRLSFAKAMYLDFPVLLTMMPFKRTMWRVLISTLFQEIRITGRQYLLNRGLGLNMSALAAGVAGGVFKYSIVGSSPLVGSISTAAYEVCSNYKSCSGTPFASIVFMMVVETLEQMAHGLVRTGRLSEDTVNYGILMGVYSVITYYGLLVPAVAAVS
jgi:hypothetical protein